MKPRQRHLAFVFASLCVIATLAAVTIQSLRLERNELRSRAVAEHEASVRLVLWRMDSMLAPILAREAATPYYHYRPFIEAGRASEPARSLAASRAGKAGKTAPIELADSLVPSPLLQSDSKLVRLYFEVDADGVRSPQAPEGEDRKLAESNFISAYRIEDNRRRLDELQTVWNLSKESHVDVRREASRYANQGTQGAGPQTYGDPVLVGGSSQVASGAVSAPAPVDASAAPRAAEPAQQQLSNDYAQRAQVAANSKLTQLEAERSAGQWRRGDDPESPTTSVDEDATRGSSAEPEVRAEAPTPAPVPAPTSGSTSTPTSEPASAAIPPPAAANARDLQVKKEEPPTRTESGTPITPGAPAPATELGMLDVPAPSAGHADVALRERDEIVDRGATTGVRDPVQGPLEPRWLTGGDEPTLVLVRQVTTNAGPVTQGLWLNWTELRGALLELAGDVFPSASIEPLPGGVANLPPDALNRCLATIPAELQVPEPSIPTPRVLSPVRVALSLAWVVAVGAIAASGLALRSATELADRRGQFVSAVTHELRTPLTTFCLYSQMLADGMVRDADAQAQYHSTLHRESQRLTRIVESVLEYARLGKRKAHAKPEATSVAALLDASLPALRDRCQGAGLELVDTRDGDMGGAIRVDRATFDRILSNLVDNACKYAAGSDPARVELAATVSASTLEIRVRDFGPGIPAAESKRIFDAFFRGSAHSDGATPGLGLGLALCKALAREMGGDLSLIQPTSGTGACFRLALPRNA